MDFQTGGLPNSSELYLIKTALASHTSSDGQYLCPITAVTQAIHAIWTDQWVRKWINHLRLNDSRYRLMAYMALALVLKCKPKDILLILNKVHGIRLLEINGVVPGTERMHLTSSSMEVSEDDILNHIDYINWQVTTGFQLKNDPLLCGA